LEGAFLLAGASTFLPASARADSGVIQLQQVPNDKDEGEGPDFTPPGVDSNLVASSGVNTNGFGRVQMTKKGTLQDFLVVADKLAEGPNAFNFAYGVFINDLPGSTSFSLVGVMDLVKRSSKDPRWELHYSNTGAAPPELGVADLADLAGLELRIISSPLNATPGAVYLHAILPPVLPNPSENSALKKITMSIPPAGIGSPPSPEARGTLTVKYDAIRGRSIISIKASKLTHGTGYTVFLEDAPGAGVYQELEELNEPANFPNSLSSGTLTLDTQKGTPIDYFADAVGDLAGRNIVVADPFFDAFNPLNSSIHLIATMPSIP
jgi:hypothetical protein